MSAFTDDDVTAAQSAWRQVFGGYAAGEEIETVLAAVAPAIYERGYSDGTLSLVRKDKEMYEQGWRDALREAADEHDRIVKGRGFYTPSGMAVWLRARAEGVES